MNSSEKLYNIQETLDYYFQKQESHNRLIKEMLRKIMEELKKINGDPLRNGITMSI
tara:strand:- start:282 stop:449 length:168 start_codon:yes stop_codon:yes gene_type:complete